ncbi:hypothetical protein [Thermococcus sp.]|uniref:hypothetical protein n=1 Tax=Thermococcus sp. TaxID=35749 RepID=UPI00260610FB|nr:hypothetical protein [Thermococcus sp.]
MATSEARSSLHRSLSPTHVAAFERGKAIGTVSTFVLGLLVGYAYYSTGIVRPSSYIPQRT